MGTPDFAVPSLRALIQAKHNVVGVFTQPDRPAGRGQQFKSSPVKVVAEELGLMVYQPAQVKTPESIALLRDLKPECIVVVAYGQILSKEILELPPQGCINVHASLLPKYRGAAPIHWAVINGETVTGVTTMLMDEGLDTGDILLKREIPVSPESTTGEVHDLLAEAGAELLVETLEEWQNGTVRAQPQTGPSCYAPLISREDERLDFGKSATGLYNQIRGLNPWPGAYTTFRGQPLKVWQGIAPYDLPPAVNQLPGGRPGEILRILSSGVIVQTGEGLLGLAEVQPAGKKRMPARDYILGRHAQPGERFGE